MKTILLANNDAAVLNNLEELLRRYRYAVVAARDVSSALAAIASEEHIDLVISDHRMNGMDDLAVLKALRQTRPDVPAIILTGRGTLDSYLQAINLGVTAYLEQTVGSRDVVSIVADALGDGVGEEKDGTSAYRRRKRGAQAGRTAYERGCLAMIPR